MLDDQLVLARTREGQNAIFDELLLNRTELRLLRLFNGFTPLGDILSRQVAEVDWRHAASRLISRGLVSVFSTVSVEKPIDKS